MQTVEFQPSQLTMPSRRGKENVDNSMKFAIISMVRGGMKQSDVALQFDSAKSTVCGIIKASKITQIVKKKKRGPKFKLNAAATCILLRLLLQNNMKPLFLTVSELKAHYGYNLTVKSVRRCIYKNGIRNYVAVSKPYLLPRHVQARKRWANMHKYWDMGHWGRVIFSDKSNFTMKPSRRRAGVWRREGERYKTINLVPTFKSGNASISVWAAFSIKGRTPLVLIEVNLNQALYLNILKHYLLPFADERHGSRENAIYQQDGCGTHRAKSVSSFLDAEKVQLLPCPAQSSDLNPIENTWAMLKRKLRTQSTYPTSKSGLFERLSEIWDKLPDSYFEKLMQSMSTRVEESKRVKCLSTKY